MPLIDALLLDPRPFEVWIAYRTDEIAGTGTLSDPYQWRREIKAALKNDAAETGGKMLLAQPGLKALFSALEQEPEVNVLAAPKADHAQRTPGPDQDR